MKIAATLIKPIVNCQLSIVLILTFLFALLTLTLALPRQAHAQACDTPGPMSAQQAIEMLNKCAIEKDIFDDKVFNLNQMSGTTDSLYTLLLGETQLHPETNTITRGGGALATSGWFVATLYSAPPISGVNYFANEIRKFNPVQPTYAQSDTIGFTTLGPAESVWRVFRNASYVAFVIIFVIIGFMIMFRYRISPQTVATVQDSIPRLIVALILVTFSYAIAGLFIDLMFLVLNIIVNFLKTATDSFGNPILDPTKANIIFEKSVFTIILDSWTDIVTTTGDAIKGMLE